MHINGHINTFLADDFQRPGLVSSWRTHNVHQRDFVLFARKYLILIYFATNIPIVAVAVDRTHRRGDDTQFVQDTVVHNVAGMPDFVATFEEAVCIGMQVAVGVGKYANLHSFTGLRCLTTSKRVMLVATETLSERMVPTIGMVTVSLQCRR